MENKMKKIAVVAIAAVVCAGTCVARPHGGPGGPRGGGPVRVVHGGGGHHHHHHGSVWGRGGSHFWPSFVGGVVGGIVADTVLSPAPVVVAPTPVVAPAPVVVTPAPVVVQTTPVYTTQNIWVEGRYVDQVQSNGTVVRVWQPGHYEQRQVVVQ